MATLAVEIKRAEAAGDKKIAGFTGAVRSLENLNRLNPCCNGL